MLAFGFASFLAALAGVLLVWWQGQIAPGDIGLQSTIDLLIVAVIGGLTRIEGAWVGALAFIVINNYVRDSWLTDLLDKVGIGGSFNTIIGLIFLVIVIVSPDGLMGLWDRLWGISQRRRGRRAERRRRSRPARRCSEARGCAKGGVSQIVSRVEQPFFP